MGIVLSGRNILQRKCEKDKCNRKWNRGKIKGRYKVKSQVSKGGVSSQELV
jgi:hypothetical protein